MRHTTRWMMAGLIGVGLQLTACGQAPASTITKVEPAKVTKIEGSELSRLELVESAVQRLAIKTVDVQAAPTARKRIVGGEVVGAGSALLVKVPLSTSDIEKVDQQVAATILPLAQTADAPGLPSEIAQPPASAAPAASAPALYYSVKSPSPELTAGQRVRVELTLDSSGANRMAVPYGAVIYDLQGTTWVYTNPEPLTFVRERVAIDYIDGDTAVLAQDLPAGTKIVSVGAAELYGTEFGVGH